MAAMVEHVSRNYGLPDRKTRVEELNDGNMNYGKCECEGEDECECERECECESEG